MASFIWTITVAIAFTALSAEAGCPSGYQQYGPSCYRLASTSLNYDEALAACKAVGGMLPEPKSAEENEAMNMARNGLNAGGNVWLGMDDRATEGTFKWHSDKSSVSYANWNGGEPNNWGSGEDCSHMRGDKTWNDLACSAKIGTICEATASSSDGACPGGFSQVGQACYHFHSTAGTMDESAAVCKQIGGFLAEPRSAEENNNVIAVANANSAGSVWIGLDDRDVEGTFKWQSDKATLTFSVWNGGEPNNWGSGEDCTHIRVGAKNWNDLNCNTKLQPICQAKLIKKQTKPAKKPKKQTKDKPKKQKKDKPAKECKDKGKKCAKNLKKQGKDFCSKKAGKRNCKKTCNLC